MAKSSAMATFIGAIKKEKANATPTAAPTVKPVAQPTNSTSTKK
jgi:hypothetical protein